MLHIERFYDTATRTHLIKATVTDSFIHDECESLPIGMADLIDNDQAKWIIEDAILMAIGVKRRNPEGKPEIAKGELVMTFEEWYKNKDYAHNPHLAAHEAYKAGRESMRPLVTALLEVAVWYGGEGMEEEAVLEATKFVGGE